VVTTGIGGSECLELGLFRGFDDAEAASATAVRGR
jgi:hypothetical protein